MKTLLLKNPILHMMLGTGTLVSAVILDCMNVSFLNTTYMAAVGGWIIITVTVIVTTGKWYEKF